ncbi:MAG: helix-turn-helix transcriptional regulator [Acidimicrobiaceae bacterium]|nr:helix-turn-helix transcriptional regulator [Acidimicrobiaceae bacterium]MDE0702044.1 helix-turn-helix transcriptional regulator [Acidimicrobiaceae bacterium]MXW62527.1 helix-turn-helix transcriptional regulator [Acidimicrobiaceae bacterium]MXW75720.1 helix-turn-helix transcriptional regulator [Acidimicrobiaceae bacterium]MYA73280.1 helix-turn-helix transcriptional regulator [Acidimicrobiaceae bacterium]
MDQERFHRAVYVISVAAELAGVHPQTLRIYERKGLVDPARTGGGSRRYSDADIALLQRISDLTDEGLNLAGVKRVLKLEARVAQLEAALQQVQSDASAAVDEVHRQYRRDLVPLHQSVTIFKSPSKK